MAKFAIVRVGVLVTIGTATFLGMNCGVDAADPPLTDHDRTV